MNMDELPKDVIFAIVPYLDAQDLTRLSLTCKRFDERSVVDGDQVKKKNSGVKRKRSNKRGRKKTPVAERKLTMLESERREL